MNCNQLRLVSGTALVGLMAMAMPAFAQEAPPEAPAASALPEPDANTPDVNDNVIIVTATRRASPLARRPGKRRENRAAW